MGLDMLDLVVEWDESALDAGLSVEAIEHGEVFTRRWIVDLILDLVGYRSDLDLATLRVVEPACGAGAFVVPLIERLSRSCRNRGHDLAAASDALCAFDLLQGNVDRTRTAAVTALIKDGWPIEDSTQLVTRSITRGDYLLDARARARADFVVGNPPYIRLEDVPDRRMQAYRSSCPTMTGRSDIYVGFYEVALRSLSDDGVLGFICADRWMRNQYGRLLRELVARDYAVRAVVSMHDVDAFEEQVSAYPAVTVIGRGRQGCATVADTTRKFGPADAAAISAWVSSGSADPLMSPAVSVARLPHWFSGGESWPAGSPTVLACLEDLEDRHPLLEDASTGTRVGIGVATGADSVYVTTDKNLVESERLLPLSMCRDIASGTLAWSGHYLVNPWDDAGLVDLDKFPRLADYFERTRQPLQQRNIAQRRPHHWYRTIDRVTPSLTQQPKLLFSDMKLLIDPVLDAGGLYPHHNLYFVTSDGWDLQVLGGLLLSDVANFFVERYTVKMRGGTLRFQAQYLRRIRVPNPESLTSGQKQGLRKAFAARDRVHATRIALVAYGLDGLPR